MVPTPPWHSIQTNSYNHLSLSFFHSLIIYMNINYSTCDLGKLKLKHSHHVFKRTCNRKQCSLHMGFVPPKLLWSHVSFFFCFCWFTFYSKTLVAATALINFWFCIFISLIIVCGSNVGGLSFIYLFILLLPYCAFVSCFFFTQLTITNADKIINGG